MNASFSSDEEHSYVGRTVGTLLSIHYCSGLLQLKFIEEGEIISNSSTKLLREYGLVIMAIIELKHGVEL